MLVGHKKLLQEESYWEIYKLAESYRISQFIQELNRTNKVGKVLPFVRGLRFQSLLIYAIREILDGMSLEASWGHIIDEKGEYCSRECDIIIHKPGCLKNWNGSKLSDPIMSFKFIEQEKVIAVISCKSFIKASQIERNYSLDLKKHVEKVWLFAECCGPRSFNNISKAAQLAGYEKFWCFYSWTKKTDTTLPFQDKWNEFVEDVRSLASLI